MLIEDAISRYHVSFKKYPDGVVVVKDLGSTNGTTFKGKRILAARLKDGDEVLIGENTLIRLEF